MSEHLKPKISKP